MKRVVFKTNEAVAYQGEAMESGDHFKNGARPAKPLEQEKYFRSCARYELGILK